MDLTSKIIGYCIAESIDRRLIYRIPYLLFIILFIAPLTHGISLFYKLLTIILTFLLLFATTIYLSVKLKNLFEEKFFENAEKLLSLFSLDKIRDIVESEHSFLDDISLRSYKIIVSGVINSVSSFIFLVIVFDIIIEQYYNQLLVIIFAISGFFIIRDILKSEIEDIKVDESKLPVKNIIEKYFVQNPIRKLFGVRTVGSIIFKIIYRLFTPTIFVELPKIDSRQFLVHWNYNLVKFLKGLIKTDKEKLSLKHIDGVPLTQLFILDQRKECAKIEDLETKCFEEIFSYMFDTRVERKKNDWSILAICRDNRTVGLMFVQCFKVVKKNLNDYKSNTAFYILLIGLKDVIEFLSLAISMKSVNVKPDEMFSDVKKLKYRRRNLDRSFRWEKFMN